MIYNNLYKIFLFVLLILTIIIGEFLIFNKNKDIKVCMCSPVKKENHYLKEFVQHYKSYNVDKIFLYDNNDLNGEHLESVLNEYVLKNYVQIINFRGKIRLYLI